RLSHCCSPPASTRTTGCTEVQFGSVVVGCDGEAAAGGGRHSSRGRRARVRRGRAALGGVLLVELPRRAQHRAPGHVAGRHEQHAQRRRRAPRLLPRLLRQWLRRLAAAGRHAHDARREGRRPQRRRLHRRLRPHRHHQGAGRGRLPRHRLLRRQREPGVRRAAAPGLPVGRRRRRARAARLAHPRPVRQRLLPEPHGRRRPAALGPGALQQRRTRLARAPLRHQRRRLLVGLRRVHGQARQHRPAHGFRGGGQAQLQDGEFEFVTSGR
ncbi:Peroxidase 52, partial [Zea mays]